jgi:hypothetical protein
MTRTGRVTPDHESGVKRSNLFGRAVGPHRQPRPAAARSPDRALRSHDDPAPRRTDQSVLHERTPRLLAVVGDRLVVVRHAQGQQADPLAHGRAPLRPKRARVSRGVLQALPAPL